MTGTVKKLRELQKLQRLRTASVSRWPAPLCNPLNFVTLLTFFIGCSSGCLTIESAARSDERSRFHTGMIFVLFLRNIQRHRAVGFAMDELLHLGIRARADFIWCTL